MFFTVIHLSVYWDQKRIRKNQIAFKRVYILRLNVVECHHYLRLRLAYDANLRSTALSTPTFPLPKTVLSRDFGWAEPPKEHVYDI